jgi:hypothetical protein
MLEQNATNNSTTPTTKMCSGGNFENGGNLDLNLPSIDKKPRVSVAFTTSEEFKKTLVAEAIAKRTTTSLLIESKLLKYKEPEVSMPGSNFADIEKNLKAKIVVLEKTIAGYENPKLTELYSLLRGEKHTIPAQDGKELSITINSPVDVFNLLLNSFKIEKPKQ